MPANISAQDVKWMKKALALAQKAAQNGEVPVGAVLVSPQGKILSQAANLRETLTSPLGHAELVALHRAARKQNSWRLEDCTLYVTLEPCIMCAGAIQQSRIGRVVFGAKDAKGGGVQSLYNILQDLRLNHQVQVTSGVLENECSQVLTQFFQNRRDEIKKQAATKQYRLRASVVVIHDNKVLGFRGIDPQSNASYFFLPGGRIETGESPLIAAEREALEETGYTIRVLAETEFRRKYDFLWNGTINHCDTVFYLGTLNEEWHPPGKIQDASCHHGVEWIDIKDIDKVFSYNKDILWAVQKLVKLGRKKSGR